LRQIKVKNNETSSLYELVTRVLEKIFYESKRESRFVLQYLDQGQTTNAELALAQAGREILRLSDAVEEMLMKSILMFKKGTIDEWKELKASDNVVDFLNKGIKHYLVKISHNDNTPIQTQRILELLTRASDLESMGDIVDKNILGLVRKKWDKGYDFSEEGWSEIQMLHRQVIECFKISTAAFNTKEAAVEKELDRVFHGIEGLVVNLTDQHLQRLKQGNKRSLESSSVHLDLISTLHRVAILSRNFSIFIFSEEHTSKIKAAHSRGRARL
jgi:phosphate:Na+ symporter